MWKEFNALFEFEIGLKTIEGLVDISNDFNNDWDITKAGLQVGNFLFCEGIKPFRHYWSVDEDIDIMNRNY